MFGLVAVIVWLWLFWSRLYIWFGCGYVFGLVTVMRGFGCGYCLVSVAALFFV